MKTPKPRHLPSGSWNIILRLGGETISITDQDQQECIKKARLIKAEYLAGQRQKKQPEQSRTLEQGIAAYMADRSNGLSPATLTKYSNIENNHWKTISNLRMDKITKRQWQQAVNDMLETYSPKTVQVSLGMIKTVVLYHDLPFPKVSVGRRSELAAKSKDKPQFLEPDQIKAFVEAAAETEYAVPLLLALSSLRIAEIDALYWDNITPDAIQIRAVRVKDKDGTWVIKPGAKNESSVRDVPILIPALEAAIARDRKPEGKVLTCCQQTLRRVCERVCKQADVPVVSIHSLRHSFASLTAHLQIPEQISQSIGGWANDKVMKQIYTHIVTADMAASLDKIKEFYSGTNQAALEKRT